MFQVSVRVSNPVEPSQSFTEKFWVDTRALYSFIPEDRLDAIGIDALRTREVVLADGRTQRRRFGEAKLTVEELGETLTCPVIFGPPGSLYLLGATALETFGVDADPVSKRLKPVAAVIGGFLEAPSSPPPPSPRG
jgi:predicted aspartyl protease